MSCTNSPEKNIRECDFPRLDDGQRRRRVVKLAHPEASECEAVRVGGYRKKIEPCRGDTYRSMNFFMLVQATCHDTSVVEFSIKH